MNPEDVLINFVVDNAQALEAAKAVEESISSIQGAVDKMHEKWIDSAKEVKDLLDPMVEKMTELNDALKDSDEHWQKKADNVADFNEKIKESTEAMEKQTTTIEGVSKGFQEATPGLQELTQAVKDGTWQIGFYTAAWNMALQYGAEAIGRTTGAVSDLIGTLNYLQVSAAFGADEMQRLTGDIIHAATETGLAFDAVASKARALYDYSGLKEGLGEVVVAGEHMNRVFGMSGEEFGRFAATAVKLSDGILTGTQLMEQFDSVVGITGYKMETLLTNLEAIGKQLAKITGGGANFATAMASVTKHVAEASAAIQQLGGDADGYQEIIGQIADPSQWDAVIDALGPGIAGSLHQMQAALTSGDMDTFNALMAEGTSMTKDMAAGMDNMTRAALGFDFRQIEVLSDLDPSKMQEMAEATQAQASVAERSAALTQNISDGINRLWNNVVAVLLKAVMPMLVEISAAITYMNEKLSDNQGQWDGIVTVIGGFLGAVGYAVGLIFRAIGALSDWIGTTNTLILTLLTLIGVVILVGMTFGKVLKLLMKPIAWLGEAVGKLVGNVFEETMAGMGRGMKKFNDASKGAEKAALVLMMVGAAMFLFGAGLMMVAQVPIATIIVTIVGLIAVLLALSLVSAYLAPAIGVMLAFGAAMMMVGAAFLFLGMGLALMSDVNFLNIAIGLVLLAGAAYLFAPAAMLMGATAPFVMMMGAALFFFGLALIPLAIMAPVLATIGLGLMVLALGLYAMLPIMALAPLILVGSMILSTAFIILAVGLTPLAFIADSLAVIGTGLMVLALGLMTLLPVAFFAPILAWGIYILSGALLALGIALLPLAFATSIFADAFQTLNLVNYSGIVQGLMDFSWAFLMLLPLMPAMFFMGWALGSLADALWDIAMPAQLGGEGMMQIAAAVYMLAQAGKTLETLDGENIGANIAAMTGAMKSGGTGFDPDEMADTIASMTMVVGMIAEMSDQIDDIIYVAERLGESEAALNTIFTSFFDPESGLLIKATRQIYYSLSTPGYFWGRNSMDISGQMESINAVIDALSRLTKMYADLAVMGAVMQSTVNDRNVGVNIAIGVRAIFNILTEAVKSIEERLTEDGWLWDSAVDISSQMKSIDGVMDILDRFNNMFAALAIMGGVMATAGTKAPTYKEQIQNGIKATVEILAGAIETINENIDGGGWFSSGDTIDDSVRESIESVSSILNEISNTYTKLAIMGGVLQAAGGNGSSILANMQFGISALFGEGGIVPRMLSMISENIDSGGWFSDGDMVDKEVLDSVQIVSGIIERINGVYQTLAILGGVMFAAGGNGTPIFVNIHMGISALFGEGGIIPRIFEEISDNLDSIDTGAIESSSSSLKQIASAMDAVSEIFSTMAILGGVLYQSTDDGVTFLAKALLGVEAMFGRDGVVTELMGSIRRASAGLRIDGEVFESINGAMGVVSRLVGMTESLTALGDGSAATTGILAMVDTVAQVNTTLTPANLELFGQGLHTYADIIEGVNSRFSEMDLSPMTDVAMAMDDVTASMTNDVSIAAEGGAELAMEELEQARNEHQLTVESLLTEIRDGIRGLQGRETAVMTAPAENTSMDFAGLFGDSSGDSF